MTANNRMQDCVTLSFTEAELVAAIMCVQDMLFTKKVLKSIELQVALPMTLHVDNKGAKDLGQQLERWGPDSAHECTLPFLTRVEGSEHCSSEAGQYTRQLH